MGGIFKIIKGKPYINKAKGLHSGKDLEIRPDIAIKLFKNRIVRRSFVSDCSKVYKLR
jgi:hypothetical protein